jgi:hypothetical protein
MVIVREIKVPALGSPAYNAELLQIKELSNKINGEAVKKGSGKKEFSFQVDSPDNVFQKWLVLGERILAKFAKKKLTFHETQALIKAINMHRMDHRTKLVISAAGKASDPAIYAEAQAWLRKDSQLDLKLPAEAGN